MPCAIHQSKAAARSTYRELYRQLSLFPVQHVRNVYRPYFRDLLRQAVVQQAPTATEAESSRSGASKAAKPSTQVENALHRAKRELNHLKAANAGYKHAFERTMEIAYGRRGWVRWQLLNSIYRTSGEQDPDLDAETPLPKHFPPVLRPLLSKPPAPQPRTTIKAKLAADTPKMKAKYAKQGFDYMLKGIQVPLTLPSSPSGVRTGWEGKGVEEDLIAIAKLDGLPRNRKPLPPKSERGPDWDQAAYLAGDGESMTSSSGPIAIKAKQPQPIYPRPPARSTRQNPKTWTRPHTLSARFIRRTAKRILDSLPPKLSFVNGHWRAERVVGKKGKGKGKKNKKRRERAQKAEGKEPLNLACQSPEAPNSERDQAIYSHPSSNI